jgi:RNA polymerase sigma-70 factor, ECF subfamily
MALQTTTYGLVERIRQGDRDAFTPLFERYRPRVAAWVRYRMGPQLRAFLEIEDVLQETFARAYREFDRFSYRAPGSFLRWLLTIAGHVLSDTARYQGREKRAGEQVPLRSESHPSGIEVADSVTPSRLLAGREKLERLFALLDELPPQYREVILLARVEGLSTQEVSERLGRSREATALLLHRALKHLRAALAAGGNL